MYFNLISESGRERDTERNIDWLLLTRSLLGMESAVPSRNSTSNLLVHRIMLYQLNHTSSARCVVLKYFTILKYNTYKEKCTNYKTILINYYKVNLRVITFQGKT